MNLDSMKPPKGSRQRRKRLGRGPGSGLGKTSARGHKGQRSRTGGKSKVGFEGGQMPMARRLPKHGFKNPFRVTYQVVNLVDLNRFEAGAAIDPDQMRTVGLAIRRMPVKVLGQGKLERALTVRAHAFSKSAVAAIEAAGGKTEVLGKVETA